MSILGKPNPQLIKAIQNEDGRIEVFVVAKYLDRPDSLTGLWHKWQKKPNGGWVANWQSLGVGHIGWRSNSSPALVQNENGRIEVFMIDYDNRLYHKWQKKPNGGWEANWHDPGGDWPNYSNPAVVQNEDGRLEVFTLNSENRIDHRWQIKPNGRWTQAHSLGSI